MTTGVNARTILEMGRGLSYEERKEVIAELLGGIDPAKPTGAKLCDAIMRVWTTVAFEAVAIRGSVATEVYLRQRDALDTAYPDEWHVPGSLYRHGERDRDVADRLEQEFGTPIIGYTYVEKLVTDEQRGTIHSMIFLVELDGNPRIDDRHNWFALKNLPAKTVSFHREPIIPMAVLARWYHSV